MIEKNWGIRFNEFPDYQRIPKGQKPDGCPEWLESNQFQTWQKQGLIIWNNTDRIIESLHGTEALELLNGLVEPTIQPSPLELEQTDALNRSFPPLAKDLFPMGVRVIAIQGLPQQTESSEDSNSFNLDTQPKMLILLVPNESREVLSLALQQGDRLVVSLMARGDEVPSAGFTYWDFEDLFKQDREEALGGGQ